MKIRNVFVIVVLVFCSGCGTIKSDPPSRVYGGVREDGDAIASGYVYYIIDVPFSFATDTLLLPFSLYHLITEPPSPGDPLVGWKLLGFESPNKAITDDYQDYIQKLPPKAGQFIGSIYMFEDGTGQHAVKVETGLNGGYWEHVLIYDKDNKRIKVIIYGGGRYAS